MAGTNGSGDAEVAVVGGGPAGLVTAILAARNGFPVVLVRKQGPLPGAGVRTTALMHGSIALLREIGVWDEIAPRTAPLVAMRLVDDTGRLVRAPTVTFEARELDLAAFGHNVPNDVLADTLERVASATLGLTAVDALASAVDIADDAVAITTRTGVRLPVRLVAAADGRESIARKAAGIDVLRWSYDQVAVTMNVAHSVPHRGISTEFHTPSGPFTLVPLPGDTSSLVAVVRPADADFLMELPNGALAAEVERRAHSILGKVRIVSGHGRFALSGLVPKRFAANRVALVGEAAHVIPPIGAQGLNLGLRDAADLVATLVSARAAGDDIGGPAVLDAYDRLRRRDVVSRSFAVDALNRTLLSPLLPAQAARGFGLFLAETVPPLRRLLVREGLGART